MKRKSLKNSLRSREKLFGAWVSYAEPSITETFAKAGFDFLAIDMEHSTITLPEAKGIITSSQSHGVPCFPRPVSHSNDYIKPLLEFGADGMLIQMVNNSDDVEKLISHIKYLENILYQAKKVHSLRLELEKELGPDNVHKNN